MLAIELPSDVQETLEAVARQRGVTIEAMLTAALREWMAAARPPDTSSTPMTRDEVLAELEAKGLRRGVAPEGAVAWQPFDWPGVLLSETIIEQRGER